MTREQLIRLQALLEQFSTEYGGDISNDRYTAIVVTDETIDSIIINTERPLGKHRGLGDVRAIKQDLAAAGVPMDIVRDLCDSLSACKEENA